MNEILGFILVLIAGLSQGTFAIFFKYTSPLKWENFWGLYAIVALILGPVIFAFLLIPNFFRILPLVPVQLLFVPMLFGAIWGVGSVLFGISLIRIGLALTYTIVLGLVTIIGTVLPIFINNIHINVQAQYFLISGLIITLLGIILSGYAGVLRDGLGKFNKSLMVGFLVAVVSGIASSMLNVAFVSGGGIAKIAHTQGVSLANASSLIWVVVLFSGFLVNIGYVLYLLVKNKTVPLYKKMTLKILLAIIAAGILWYMGFALFGLSANMLGKLGPSVGWAILISLSIVISNVWSIKFGEWKNSDKALNIQLKSLGLIIIGIVSIAISVLQ